MDQLKPAPDAPRTRFAGRAVSAGHQRIILVAIVLAAAGLAFAAAYWLHGRGHESTDDAFIDGHVIMISSKVEGQAARIHVDDNQQVREGQALVDIDPADYQVRLDQARAQLEAARAEARRTEGDAASARQLFAKDRISRQSFDHAAAAAEEARAKARLAARGVEAAQLNLSYTRITAPADGKVTRKAVELRNFVRVGAPLMALVSGAPWVTANFKETQLARMRTGQKVRVRVDAYPSRVFAAHVDSFQAGTGARFSLLPPENATGNYVKVVQRVPVKIVFDEDPAALAPLAPGMSAVPDVDIR